MISPLRSIPPMTKLWSMDIRRQVQDPPRVKEPRTLKGSEDLF